MVLKKVPPSFNEIQYSAPSKVFILGEYAVLVGLPALVLCHGPRFTLRAPFRSEKPTRFALESPAGLLIKWVRSQKASARIVDQVFEFQDPYQGAGGFGASSAQFGLLYYYFANSMGWPLAWFEMWQLYRELTTASGKGLPPSGADVAAQWQGGAVVFNRFQCQEVWGAFPWKNFLIFSATSQEGRKVASHEHLATLEEKAIDRSQLSPSLEKGMSAVSSGDVTALGTAIQEYAEVLNKLGFESSAAREDRLALQSIQGVAGVKGSGALLSDAVLVLLKEGEEAGTRPLVMQTALARGLKLIHSGGTREEGIS